MKHPDRTTVSRLDHLPNIGKAISKHLNTIGITHPRQLIGKNPFELYHELCFKMGKSYDPCVIDVFMSAIRYMEGGTALPWWSFTPERKQTMPHSMTMKVGVIHECLLP